MTWLVLGLVAAVTPVIIIGAARWFGRRPQRIEPGLLYFLVWAALVAGLTVAMMVHGRDSDHRRCVETATLTVVPPARCQGAPASSGPASSGPAGTGASGTGAAGVAGTGAVGTGAAGAPPVVEWYYGGSGTGVGDQVRGGSVSPPSDEDGSFNGDTGGEDGSFNGDTGGEVGSDTGGEDSTGGGGAGGESGGEGGE
jgi:hypothetical protein